MSKRRATLIDVAERAGVSRATASLVIRNSPLVAATTRARVELAMQELGYVHNLGAARLRADKSRIVGLVVPNLTNPFFAELLAGVEEVVNAAGLVVLLANSGDNAEHQHQIMRRMLEHGVDGMIVCPAAESDAGIFSEIAGWKIPFVQVLRHVSKDTDYVGPDYCDGMRQAVDYLVALGHQRIAFAVQGPAHSAYNERVSGFCSAMSAHGLDPSAVVRLPLPLAQIALTTDRLFDAAKPPTATICFNDVIAFGLSSGFYDRKIRIPCDHSIVGFDDVMDAEAIRPRLTSISTKPAEIGKEAARSLIQRLREEDSDRQWIITETRLIERESCGTP